ncbi:MAG: PilT/PilU family type 4a pilus ATPase [Candidatus Riflebacteria bacterium]|nr:PilT/PilU family type 4a pilus ATPase [Candidatus Riflebacteria bacterium]
MNLKEMLSDMVTRGATDILLSANHTPMCRFGDRLLPYGEEPFRAELIRKMVFEVMLDEEHRSEFEETGETDVTVNLQGVGRFRASVYRQRGEMSVAFRTIRARVPTLEELQLPPSVERLLDAVDGLVLVGGPSDSGKTTTVAAMLDHLNARREGHIVTVEDPIEFILPSKKCLVSQRELGRDTASYRTALKVILRQAPDIVFIDEMPDLETVAGVLKLAETGHLVISTLPARTAAQAVDRLIDIFPPYQQQQIRAQLALTLRGIVIQQLLPATNGSDRIAAREVLVATPSVTSLIQENKTHLLPNVIAQNGSDGMVSMDTELRRLAESGTISEPMALARASDPAALASAHPADTSLAGLEKALYDHAAEKRRAAEMELKRLAAGGNRSAADILEQFGRFYQTNFEERKIGLRRG